MTARRSFLRSESGTTIVLIGVMFLTIMAVVGLAVDMGRIYNTNRVAQQALDAGLLAGVARSSTRPVEKTTVDVFNANYPDQYLGSTVKSVSIDRRTDETENGEENVWNATAVVMQPTMIMRVFGTDEMELTVHSQVTRGFDVIEGAQLDLALVLDNTGSMNGAPITALKNASIALVNILYGNETELDNLRISVVPYDVTVQLDSTFVNPRDFIKSTHYTIYDTALNTYGMRIFANRNLDFPPNASNDFTDDVPVLGDDLTKFRTPSLIESSHWVGCGDAPFYGQNPNNPSINGIARVLFSERDKNIVISRLNEMMAGVCTRIPVGLMWGWYTLSPKWQGRFDPGKPNEPRDFNSARLTKAIVLMTDGLNTVADGRNGSSVDDNTTSSLCNVIKSAHPSYTIYAIGLGAANQNILRNCATSVAHYFYAPTPAQLQQIFEAIADDILNSSIYLSK